jgi:hypothetical protein
MEAWRPAGQDRPGQRDLLTLAILTVSDVSGAAKLNTRQGIDARLAMLTTLAKAGRPHGAAARTGYREVPDEGDCGDG